MSRVSRRRFLEEALPAAGAVALSPAFARPAGAGERASPPVAVFSKVYQELKLNFEESAEVTAAGGLDGIDCTVRPGGEIAPAEAAEQIPRYGEALRRHGVDMLLLTTAIVGASSPHAGDILRAGKKLGVRYYRLGYWSHRPGLAAEKVLAEARAGLKEAAAMNRELGICGVYQNHSASSDHARRNAGCDLVELFEMVKDLDPDEIGVAFDLGHAIIEHGDRWREHFNRLKPHIRVVYIKDVRRPSSFVRFGQGEFAQSGFFGFLAGMNYRAPLSMHLEYQWAGAKGRTREALVAALKESRGVLGQWLARA